MSRHRTIRASFALVIGAWLCALGCGGLTLDLGRDEGPGYATPATIAREVDAAPGTPTMIASHQYGAYNIVVDDTRVYWTTAGAPPPGRVDLAQESCVVRSCKKDNCADTERGVVRSCAKQDCAGTLVTYAVDQTALRRLAVNETHVFWTVAHSATVPFDAISYSIVACPLAGCKERPSDVALGLRALDFGLDESFIYLRTSEAVVRCPIHGCQGTPTVLATLSHGSSTFAFAVGATHVFWTEGQGSSNSSETIMMVPKDGSADPHALAEGGHLVDSLRNDQAKVYWVEGYAAGTVKSCAMPNCHQTMTTLASSQTYPHLLDVTVDRASWFVLTSGVRSGPVHLASAASMGQLVECPTAACISPLTSLARDEPNPAALASDATHIYWIALDGVIPQRSDARPSGTVKRIRRTR